jgi:SAM-dependent methyltransferase
MIEAWRTRVYADYAGTAPGVRTSADVDFQASQRQHYLRRYRRFLPDDRSAHILDIGCGDGTFLEALRSIGYTNVHGVDVSPSQVEAAAQRGVRGVIHRAAIDHLREHRNEYALITAFSILEHHTREELFELLAGIREALLPEGRLIGVVPNAKGLFGAHVRFGDITHELSFTPGSVTQVCAIAGFDPPTVLEHGPLVHGPASAVRWLVWQLFRAVLLAARVAESGDIQWRVFTQDLVFVARKRP